MKEKCVVLLSGGMDSSTLLVAALRDGYDVQALTLFYGQRHQIEIDSARAVANYFKVPHRVADILPATNNLLQGSALLGTEMEMPHGHYEDESMRVTVVPGRNTILLSLAFGFAASIDAQVVAYAAHAGDHAIYPDCRKEYVRAMQEVFKLGHYSPIRLWVPFLDMDKGDILTVGLAWKVPYELTWTCYDPQGPDPYGDYAACGKCGACQERLEGFAKAGVKDPVYYSGA